MSLTSSLLWHTYQRDLVASWRPSTPSFFTDLNISVSRTQTYDVGDEWLRLESKVIVKSKIIFPQLFLWKECSNKVSNCLCEVHFSLKQYLARSSSNKKRSRGRRKLCRNNTHDRKVGKVGAGRTLHLRLPMRGVCWTGGTVNSGREDVSIPTRRHKDRRWGVIRPVTGWDERGQSRLFLFYIYTVLNDDRTILLPVLVTILFLGSPSPDSFSCRSGRGS